MKTESGDFVGQVIAERAFKNREAAEQWAKTTKEQIESKNLIAKATGKLNIEGHLWEPA